MNCPNCGAQTPDTSSFCETCGTPIAAAQPATPITDTYQQQPAAPQAVPTYGQSAPAYTAQQPQPQMRAAPYAPAAASVQDSGSIGWGVLGFFFPLVGLILFLVWRTKKPKCAKVAGIGAIIGFVLSVVYMLINGS